MTQESAALTTEERAIIDGLLRQAYRTRVEPTGEYVDGVAAVQPPHVVERAYQEWLESRPADVELFCRLMRSTYLLCRTGKFNVARSQVAQDLLTRRIEMIHSLMQRVPEVLELIAAGIQDDARFTRTVYLLSQLIPAPSRD